MAQLQPPTVESKSVKEVPDIIHMSDLIVEEERRRFRP